jgi:hypothetical protein
MKWAVLLTLLLTSVAFAIDGDMKVTFHDSRNNDNGVKVVTVIRAGKGLYWTLACNEDQDYCVTPEHGKWYILAPLTPKEYRRYPQHENYMLLDEKKGREQPFGAYWLLETGRCASSPNFANSGCR